MLESWRLYTTEEWFTDEKMIETVKGVVTPTPAMQVGRAYHAVLESPERYRVPHGYICDGYQFSNETMMPMFVQIDRRGVFEVKATKDIDGVTLVAQADHLCGAELHEFKTTTYFEADKYINSLQWRVMAWIFEPLVIRYHVASLDDHLNGVVECREVNSLTLYPYAELENDCRAVLREFVAYVRVKGLESPLAERQRAAVT